MPVTPVTKKTLNMIFADESDSRTRTISVDNPVDNVPTGEAMRTTMHDIIDLSTICDSTGKPVTQAKSANLTTVTDTQLF